MDLATDFEMPTVGPGVLAPERSATLRSASACPALRSACS